MLKAYELIAIYKTKHMNKENFMNYFKDCKTSFEFTGEKILTYSVKGNRKGCYASAIFLASGEKAKEIEENIKKDENVIKEVLVRSELSKEALEQAWKKKVYIISIEE